MDYNKDIRMPPDKTVFSDEWLVKGFPKVSSNNSMEEAIKAKEIWTTSKAKVDNYIADLLAPLAEYRTRPRPKYSNSNDSENFWFRVSGWIPLREVGDVISTAELSALPSRYLDKEKNLIIMNFNSNSGRDYEVWIGRKLVLSTYSRDRIIPGKWVQYLHKVPEKVEKQYQDLVEKLAEKERVALINSFPTIYIETEV